ncbi:MAG TPA: lysophospholipid acyltransferase family protein [Gemmatimonadota bacterium]
MWRTAYAWLVGVAYTVFWASLGIVTWPLSPSGDLYLEYARIWSGWILGSLGIPLAVVGRERLDPDTTYVLMSNHQSVFDIFALFRGVDHPLRMVAKRGLFWIPVLGWSMWMCGFIPIDRSKRDSAIRSLDRAARRIRSGVSVLVFPEGTRSRDGTLHPFKKGGFMLALKAGVPVVPVVVLGTGAIMEKGSLRVGRADVEVRIGPPIAVEGRGPESRDRLMAEVRRAMIDLGATACEDAAA